MKKLAFSSAFVVIFFLVPFSALPQEAPAPVFQEGDFWHFKVAEKQVGTLNTSNPFDGRYEVFYSKGNFRTFQMTNNGREPTNRVARGPLLALVGQNPMVQDLKFPFSVGQKWEYKFEFTMIGAKKPLLQTVEMSVTGVEQVATPAGNFSAFKLEKQQTSAHGLHPWVGTYYYSADTKSVVKYFFDSSTNGTGTIREGELIKFGTAH